MKDTLTDEEFLSVAFEHISRTFFVATFADACDDEEIEFAPRGQAAGAQENWFDTVTDETPKAATAEALWLITEFERTNGFPLREAWEKWFEEGEAQNIAARKLALPYFFYKLTMQSLGTGVGLADDFSLPAPFNVPYSSFSCFDWL